MVECVGYGVFIMKYQFISYLDRYALFWDFLFFYFFIKDTTELDMI